MDISKQKSFADMFEKSLVKMERLEPGQAVESTIVSISKDCVFIQLSGKSEGIIEKDEFLDANGVLAVAEGDSIKAFFREAKNGEMYFTTRIRGEKAGPNMLEQAWTNGIPVQGTVSKEIKGGYEIMIGESRAFCPYSQMGERRNEDSSACLGKNLAFKIIEYSEKGRNILVSNRALIEEDKQKKNELLKNELQAGMTVGATVLSLQKFGAFVDIKGFQALLPVSEISRGRVAEISDVLTVGQEITVEILDIDWNKERMSVSMKRLTDDPWTTVAERYPLESRHTGTVSRIAHFGAFVTLEDGVDGLLHSSELRGDGKYNNTDKAVAIGEKLTVIIKEVDVKGKRISLKQLSSFEQDATAQAWLDDRDASDTYNPFAALLKKK